MASLTLEQRLEAIAARFRKPDAERLAWEEPLRTALLRKLLAIAVAAEALFLALTFSGALGRTGFPWLGLEAFALLIIAGWLLWRRNIVPAATLLVVSVSHVAAYVTGVFGLDSFAPALLLPTIIIAGLVLGGYFLGGWTAVCALVLLWISSAESARFDWRLLLFWCVFYAATAYLVWLFASHLEKLLAASRRAEADRRDAVLEERTRMAREIHDTLAQGFTGIVVQINAAEQATSDKHAGVWQHLEKARALARQSLAEARRSILALRTSDTASSDLLRGIETTARQLIVDDSTTLEVASEGAVYPLANDLGGELLRVGQEAVTNAIRHARARKIDVRLRYEHDRVTLRIHDDGVGFSRELRGLGIQGMEERIRRLGGKFMIESKPGAGTAVIASVPTATSAS